MKIELLGGVNREERAKIISAAGNLSRTSGTVFQVYESRDNYESNVKLIKRIIEMGHKSILEHDYYVFGLQDVTPIIEQIIIGYRLSSFTIKSRREVDFSRVGYYQPIFHDKKGNIHPKNQELLTIYNEHMQYLFHEYSKFLEKGIKKEDARFVLPYSYYSNIIMGMDARELERLTTDLLYGNVSHITEARELGERLKEIIEQNIPYMENSLKNRVDHEDEILDGLNNVGGNEFEHLEKSELVDYTKDADNKILRAMIVARKQCSYKVATQIVDNLSESEKRKYMRYLIENSSQRELEQVSFQYQIPISLAVLTHLTRHRMHSLMVPNFAPLWDFSYYDIPESIRKIDEEGYLEIYRKNNQLKEQFVKEGVRDEDLVYFYLSGQMCNVLTTMNGSCLRWISSMRCCNKAQAQIRKIANELVAQAKEVSPLFGEGLGASCDVFGTCPEGKESCGKIIALKKQER